MTRWLLRALTPGLVFAVACEAKPAPSNAIAPGTTANPSASVSLATAPSSGGLASSALPSGMPSAGPVGSASSTLGSSASGSGEVASASAQLTNSAPVGSATSPPASDTAASTSGDAAAPPAGSAAWQEAFPTFTRHTIADFDSGYYTVVFDVDGDGKLDVVALSSGAAGLAWFKNPTWERFDIKTDTTKFICMAPYDVNHDGHTDLAIASEFDMSNANVGGKVSWIEAPADPTTDENWALHPIDAIPTSHRVRWADLDGDGTKELIDLPIFGTGSTAPTHAGAVKLTTYHIPSDPTGAWQGEVLDESRLEVAHGISIVDWDGDGADDILTAANDGVDLFRPSLGTAPQQLGAGKDGTQPDRGSSEISLGTLGGARFLATIEPWHGTDTVIYTPGASEAAPWVRKVLGTDYEHGHAMAAADLNGDGFDEVIGGGGQGTLAQIIYRYVPSSESWERIELDIGGVAVSATDIADLNGDGALDIVAIGGSPTNNVVWYENMR